MQVFFAIVVVLGLLISWMAFANRRAPSDSVPMELYFTDPTMGFIMIFIGLVGFLCVRYLI